MTIAVIVLSVTLIAVSFWGLYWREESKNNLNSYYSIRKDLTDKIQYIEDGDLGKSYTNGFNSGIDRASHYVCSDMKEIKKEIRE